MIFQSECLTFLKERRENVDFVPFDLTVTSPPYNKLEGKNQGALVSKVQYDSIADSLPEDEYQRQQIELCNLIFQLTKDGGHFFYNHKMRWLNGQLYHPLDWLRKTDWVVRQEIIWNRTIASNIRGWRFWNIDERIYWLYKPVGDNKIGTEMLSKFASLSTIWNILPERVNDHPAPYPIDLPTRIIGAMLGTEPNKSQLVFDPYSGSGTTWLAAHWLGKSFIGTELSETYRANAIARLADPPKEDRKRFELEMSIYTNPPKNDFFEFGD